MLHETYLLMIWWMSPVLYSWSVQRLELVPQAQFDSTAVERCSDMSVNSLPVYCGNQCADTITGLNLLWEHLT